MTRILIVEDEPTLLLSLRDTLHFEGYELIEATDGQEGLRLALQEHPDLIILDIMLPKLDGFSVCRAIKKERPTQPILMVSARDQSIDVVRGLELGADDYIKKPFEMAEFIARVRVCLRRNQRSEISAVYSFGNITLDFDKMEATREGQPLSLTHREYQIFRVFIEHRGSVVHREHLLNEVWGYDSFPTTRTVDNYILRLRKLIEE